MPKSKQTKALEFSKNSRAAIRERDKGFCIFCGRRGTDIMHYIRRSHGGLGIPENGALGCRECHGKYDGYQTDWMAYAFADYLRGYYPGWDEMILTYHKWEGFSYPIQTTVLRRDESEQSLNNGSALF